MNNTIQYKGYVGSVEFSEEDGVFYGKVMGIRSLISYEGENAKELLDDFHGAIDDYLEICKKESIMNRKGLKLQLESLSAQRPAFIHNAMSSLILIVRVLSGVQILPIFKENISMG